MPDAHYTHPRLVALYDFDSPWSEDRDFYLTLAGDRPIDVLEIGAGTGMVSRAMAAKGHRVVAADPAQAMLDHGQNQPDGDRVTWIKGAAADLALVDRFDLIFMTGNVFQVFGSPDEAAQAIQNAATHLKPGGRLAFETRNPAIDWALAWQQSYVLDTPEGPVPHTRIVHESRDGYIRFETRYVFGNEVLTSHSRLQFLDRATIAGFLDAAGFAKVQCFGDWSFGAFDPDRSRPIVFLAESPAEIGQ